MAHKLLMHGITVCGVTVCVCGVCVCVGYNSVYGGRGGYGCGSVCVGWDVCGGL